MAALCLLSSCGQLEPEPPLDEEGEPIPMPDPHEEWLYFEEFAPEDEISIRPTIAITFNTYVNPSTFTSYAAARLTSRDIRNSGRVDYRMTRKQVLFRPNASLEPDLSYVLEWRANDVESVTGSPLHPFALLPRYTTNDELEMSPPLDRPNVQWEEVEELFDRHCNDCHGDSSWQLPELTRDGLVGTRSQQVESMLVEPFHPARSYLMHKILPDYPIRRFTEQPPPWSDAEPLSIEEIERIEHWIAAGAPR